MDIITQANAVRWPVGERRRKAAAAPCTRAERCENQTQARAQSMMTLTTRGYAPVDKQTLMPVLQQLRFTEALPEHVLEQLASASVLRGYAAETVLFREGTQNHELMVICVGCVALDMLVPGRGEVRILSLGPGDVVAWSALLGGGRMTTSAVALEDTQVVSISAAALLTICETDATFGYYLMRRVAGALADRLIATRLQLLDLFADSAPLIPQGPD